MKPTIEHPKVFISYAWGSDEYQERVLSFASDLQNAGIEVLLDKWSLIEGHDTYAYMERCVDDDSVTNVLILIDPLYAKKANSRSGGVGTETQIISAEIYSKTEQRKFIPVLMEREENGSISKPHYLQHILHFDLSVPEKYDEEYKRLVKSLYGIQIHTKPELGTMPNWITDDAHITGARRLELQSLKKNTNPRAARVEYLSFLNGIKERVLAYSGQSNDALEIYDGLLPFRNEYLEALKTSEYIPDANILIGDFLQELFSTVASNPVLKEHKKMFIHEIFIYTVAYFFKTKEFDYLGYLLNRPFLGERYYSESGVTGCKIFYQYCEPVDQAKRKKDSKNYYSGQAQLWIDNLAVDFCNKNEFVFADLLLYNHSVFSGEPKGWDWFPLLYVYGGEYNIFFRTIVNQLLSKETVLRWLPIFGLDSVETFKKNLERAKGRDRVRYHSCFEEAALITDFVPADKIGSIA